MDDYGSMTDEQASSLIQEVQPSDTPATYQEGTPQITDNTPKELEYEYNALGKKIKEPLSMVLKRASQGYDYAQKMSEFKKQQDEFQGKFQNYSDIDSYAQQNPTWWNHVVQAYQTRDQNGQIQNVNQPNQNQNFNPDSPAVDQPDPFASSPHFQRVNQELQEMKSWKQQLDSEKAFQAQQVEDSKLDAEIKSIQSNYPNIDFTTPNEEGKSLEFQVLAHMRENGIKSFRVGFRDHQHDQLLSLAQEKAKEKVAKDFQNRTKLGLLSSGPAPREITPAQNLKQMSYNDL